MEWICAIRKSLEYIEKHLRDNISVQAVSDQVYLSQVHFQKGFQVMTGYSVAEYIRNRRLYLAALALRDPESRVIDIAFDYGYETPESFTKAFTRFHGSSPSSVKQGGAIRTFLPLSIRFNVSGGDKMNVKIKNMFGFQVIGFPKVFEYETARREIVKFWDEICGKYAANVYAGNPPRNEYEKALMDHCIGEYGVCIDDESIAGKDRFVYLIAGKFTGGKVPDGMMLYEFPRQDWAVFDCIGPMPEALQTMNDRIFKEWLPGNPDYEMSGRANMEWYDCLNGEKTDPDYHTAIWLPVKRRDDMGDTAHE